MKIKALIIDDEYLARQRLLKLLKLHDEIIVIGECKNGVESIAEINRKNPDLVFLDIQMPDLNGFEVLQRINSKNFPFVIFTTAFDEYAIKAFEVHAVDYLLKPFDNERLIKSIEEVKKRAVLKNSAHFEDKLKNLLKSYEASKSDFVESFLIKEKGYEIEVLASDLLYIESVGNYMKLWTEDRAYMYRGGLSAMEVALNPKFFIRIQRGIILNLNYVKLQKYLTNKEFQFQLYNGKILISGRTYYETIAQSLR